MSILTILNQLASTPSTNDKLAIIELHKDNITFENVCYFTYNPKIKYFIKKRPSSDFASGNMSLARALHELTDNVVTRVKTGNSAIEHVKYLLNELTEDDQEVLLRVIERDLKCGVSSKLLNKVFGKNFIPEYPVQLCSKYEEKSIKKITYPAYFQKKEDGGRVNLEFKDGKCISVTTRNGNVLSIKTFDDITVKDQSHFILDGELLYAPGGVIADRQLGNGFITKAIRDTISEEDAKNLIFVCWDYIPYNEFIIGKSPLRYDARFSVVLDLIDDTQSKLRVVENEVVYNLEEALEKYERNLALGYEGGILKNMDAIWEAKRISGAIKLKAEKTGDFLVVGFNYGAKGTQFEGMLGSLICQTSCGKLQVNVGSGFKQNKGERDDPESYIDKIIEVKYNAIIENKGDDMKSLFLPIYKCVRSDKDTANSLEELA